MHARDPGRRSKQEVRATDCQEESIEGTLPDHASQFPVDLTPLLTTMMTALNFKLKL